MTHVRLFHGTTAKAAKLIREQGFRPRDVRATVELIARENDKTVDELWDDLKRMCRFVTMRQPGDRVFLIDDFSTAQSYASRGSEAEWEALWAVYRLNHPSLGAAWNGSQEGHWWVMKHRLNDVPVVLTCEVPVALLEPKRGREETVKLPAKGIQIVEERPQSWLIDRRLLGFVSGLAAEELDSTIAAGVWGPYVTLHLMPHWSWDNVLPRLGHERRAALGL